MALQFLLHIRCFPYLGYNICKSAKWILTFTTEMEPVSKEHTTMHISLWGYDLEGGHLHFLESAVCQVSPYAFLACQIHQDPNQTGLSDSSDVSASI